MVFLLLTNNNQSNKTKEKKRRIQYFNHLHENTMSLKITVLFALMSFIAVVNSLPLVYHHQQADAQLETIINKRHPATLSAIDTAPFSHSPLAEDLRPLSERQKKWLYGGLYSLTFSYGNGYGHGLPYVPGHGHPIHY